MPPKTLVDAIKARTFVPFVGSGLSVSVGRGVFPDWKGLIELLARKLEDEQLSEAARDVRDHLTAKRFPEAAELASEKLKSRRFGNVMTSAFRIPRPPAADLSAVEALWRLRPPAVITTNYDAVLAWPFEPRVSTPYPCAMVRPKVVHNDDPGLVEDLVGATGTDQDPFIWHLHGSVERPSTIILTKRQYEGLYGADHKQTKEYVSALEQFRGLIANRVLLFIGFSLDDPFVCKQLDYILDVTAKQNPVSFLLMKKGEKDPAEILKRYQVQIIEFEDFGPPMVRAINELAEAAWGLDAPGATVAGALVDLVDGLRRILQRMAPEPAVVGRAFNRWKPVAWPAFPLGGDGISLALAGVEKLASAMRQGNGHHPLLELVRDIAAAAPDAERSQLTTWIGHAAAALGANAADRAALKAGGFSIPEGATSDESYVLVRFEEEGTETWRVQAWLFSGGEPQKLFPDERSAGRGDLPAVIYELLDQLAALELAPEQTAVAFMVPRALLIEAIDQLAPMAEFTPSPPIGVSHAVTVRPLERLKHPTNLRRLGTTWKELKKRASSAFRLDDALPSAVPQGAVWLTPADAGPALIERLQKNNVVCAVLAAPPAASAAQPASDLFSCVLQAAVPAVFWLREPAAADLVTARTRIAALLEEQTKALPHRVWQLRQSARDLGQPAHPGQCLVLLWDDADRLPPDRNPMNRAGIPRT